MEERKSKNIIIILLLVIIAILATLVVLFATNTISFNPNNNNNDNLSNENIVEENDNSEDNVLNKNENTNWKSYLLSLHILDAKITRIRSVDLGDTEDLNKTITISYGELEQLLSKIENNKLFKTYSQGRGGPDRDHLVVSYEYNEEKYEFEIFYGAISVDKLDENFKNILNNNNYEEKNTEDKNSEGSFYYYDIDGYSSEIFDEYFN